MKARLIVLALLSWGCPNNERPAPDERCTKAYDKCLLESGALGICDVATCPEGQPEPCLVCRSQH